MASRETSPGSRLQAVATRWVAVVDRITLERHLWSVVVLALVADVHTTAIGLEQGFTEGNPLMRWAIGVGGIGALALTKVGILAVGVAIRRRWPRYNRVVPLAMAIPWVAVAVVNVVTIA